MVKSLALLLLTGTLAACGSNPKAEATPAPSESQKGCYQADWQAETMPVINKRIGNERLEQYDAAPNGQEQGCP